MARLDHKRHILYRVRPLGFDHVQLHGGSDERGRHVGREFGVERDDDAATKLFALGITHTWNRQSWRFVDGHGDREFGERLYRQRHSLMHHLAGRHGSHSSHLRLRQYESGEGHQQWGNRNDDVHDRGFVGRERCAVRTCSTHGCCPSREWR